MKIKRVMIAAPASGKTVVTCALLQALKDGGHWPVSFKTGPDYIDPMFHEKVLGIPAKNLDTFFTGGEQTVELFLKDRKESDFAVLEGVMGLYDGLGGVRGEGSAYHLARVTKTPIVLAADVKGMGRSILPLLAGFLDYDKEHLIQGVLLNRISKGYYEIFKPLIEEELGIAVVGFLPEREEYHIGSRHLGLVMPEELRDITERPRAASAELKKTVSMETIIEIAQRAPEIRMPDKTKIRIERRALSTAGVTIAVARDEKLPDGCHALLIGGGYPELYAKKLSDNRKMREAVSGASKSGMSVVAECGGFLYLHSTITDKEGNCYDMAGVIAAGLLLSDVFKGRLSGKSAVYGQGREEIKSLHELYISPSA